MFRRLFLTLLVVSVVSPLVYAQDPVGFAGPEFFRPDVRRLPPLAPLPLPAEAAGSPAAGEVVAEPPLDAPSAEEFLPQPQPEPETQPQPEPDVKLWEGSFELGLDGTDGNSETFNFRLGFDAKRKTDCSTLDLDLDYRKTTSEDLETANRAFFDWRFERNFQASPWTYFVHGTVDYDEFQAFDARVTVDLGVGRHLIKTERTSLAARLGSGFSREIGGADDTYVPEAVFGLDFEHRISERHKFTASAEYTPDMTGMNDFRLRSRASWEALIDKEMNLSLKLSVLDRYDSTPNGARPNDLDYSAVLLWRF